MHAGHDKLHCSQKSEMSWSGTKVKRSFQWPGRLTFAVVAIVLEYSNDDEETIDKPMAGILSDISQYEAKLEGTRAKSRGASFRSCTCLVLGRPQYPNLGPHYRSQYP